jgi:hypothetical protein
MLAMGVLIFMGMSYSSYSSNSGNEETSQRVDLQVESVQLQPPVPSAQNPIAAVASIRNNGSASVQNFFMTITIRKAGKTVRVIRNIPSLASLPRSGSGQSIPVSIGLLPPGEYEFIASVDPANAIFETNETNNDWRRFFRVTS